MSDKLQTHFRDSYLQFFRVPERLQAHRDWLAGLMAAADPKRDEDHYCWLRKQLRDADAEIAYRQNQHGMFKGQD